MLRSVLTKFPVMSIRSASSMVAKFEQSAATLPMREAVRYTNKNMKWTAHDVKRYADAHANALLEYGFQTGDAIAVMLPDGAEKHVTLLAAAKMGMKVYDIDTTLSSVTDMRKVLADSSCKAIYFEPTNEVQDNLKLLRKSIPEFFYYDDSHGQFFHSKHFPTLKFFIHTGFDVEQGCLTYKSLFLHNPATSAVDTVAASLKDTVPFYSAVQVGKSGVTVGALKTQGEVVDLPAFSFLKKLVSNQYFELP